MSYKMGDVNIKESPFKTRKELPTSCFDYIFTGNYINKSPVYLFQHKIGKRQFSQKIKSERFSVHPPLLNIIFPLSKSINRE